MDDLKTTDDYPSLRDIVQKFGLWPKKSLGQNFIFDGNVTDKIVRKAGDLSGLTVVEIGPGPGGLTRSILRTKVKKVIAIEKDDRCIHALKHLNDNRLMIVSANALDIDPRSFDEKPVAIISNLPYNIATPLLLKWLVHAHDYYSFTLMFQKEVADRLIAVPSTGSYGRLSVMTQWKTLPTSVMMLPPNVFVPPPKVHSAVVHMVPKPYDQRDWSIMERIVACAFGQRRKQLRSSLAPLGGADLCRKTGIDPTLRAENLSVDDFLALADQLEEFVHTEN